VNYRSMYGTILVPTDGSAGAVAAAEHAIDIAGRYDATVHALYVVDVRMSPVSSGMDHDEIRALFEASSEDPARDVLARAERAGVPAVEAVEVGVPHEVVREYVTDHGVDLVVMGTHGRTGLGRTLLGSLTERVIRTVDAPVLTVRADEN
jgi:nucleotide-binding universal stress UspA family protein